MTDTQKLLVFQIAKLRFALPVSDVEMAIQVVEIRPMIKMPKYLLGLINMDGQIIPILNIRHIFGLKRKSIELTDQIVIVKSNKLSMGILVDRTHRLIEIEEKDIINTDEIEYNQNFIKGVVKLKDGMVLINDINKFLSSDELNRIENLMEKELEKQKK